MIHRIPGKIFAKLHCVPSIFVSSRPSLNINGLIIAKFIENEENVAEVAALS